MYKPLRHAFAIRNERTSHLAPAFVEYAYYALIWYSTSAELWGISVPLVGAAMMAALAAFCVMRLGFVFYERIASALGCAISFVVLQMALHGQSLFDLTIRSWITWIFALIIVQSLSLRRGFLHRFALVAFVIGLTTLPSLRVTLDTTELARLGLERGSPLSNPNGLAAWFGFCVVYFTILGLETKRAKVRVVSWVVAFGCLFVVALTVSRGPLFASVLAIVLSLRHLLKRSFLPVLLLVMLSWGILESGLFDRTLAFYTTRGMSDTGRLAVWPIAIQRSLGSPWVGVGATDIETYVASRGKLISPHNSFLLIALASGVIPLAFFLLYWIRAAQGVFRSNAEKLADGRFLIPLFIYAFLITQILNQPFTLPFMTVTLATAIGYASRGTHPFVRIQRLRTAIDRERPYTGGVVRRRLSR